MRQRNRNFCCDFAYFNDTPFIDFLNIFMHYSEILYKTARNDTI